MASDSPYGFLGDFVLWCLLYASLIVHTVYFFRYFPRNRLHRSRLVLGNGLVLLLLLGFIGLAAETYLRFFSMEIDSFGVSLPARRWFERHVRLNSLGFRDREWTEEKPLGVRRVAFVGDSFVYGWGIQRPGDRFADRVQAAFDRLDPGAVEVMTVAKPGWDTAAETRAAGEIIENYRVDEVVLCYVPNDIEKLLPRSGGFDPTEPPEPVYVNISGTCVADWLHRRLWLPRAATVVRYHDWLAEGFAEPDIWKQHQQQLFDFVRQCRDRGAAVRVVLLPFLRTTGEKFNTPRLHAVVRRYFETNRIEALDLAPIVAGRDPAELTVSAVDSHPNVEAHGLFAAAVWKAFYENRSP